VFCLVRCDKKARCWDAAAQDAAGQMPCWKSVFEVTAWVFSDTRCAINKLKGSLGKVILSSLTPGSVPGPGSPARDHDLALVEGVKAIDFSITTNP
jgi:hypothetical protein